MRGEKLLNIYQKIGESGAYVEKKFKILDGTDFFCDFYTKKAINNKYIIQITLFIQITQIIFLTSLNIS